MFLFLANAAAAVGVLVWFLLYFPYAVTNIDYDMLNHAAKIAMSLGSNSALALGFSIILDFESQGTGIQKQLLCLLFLS